MILRKRRCTSLAPMDRAAPQTSFTADCTSCAALCCFVLPFDKSAAFGFDKAAGVPCRVDIKSYAVKIENCAVFVASAE